MSDVLDTKNKTLFGLEVIITDSLWEFPYRRFVQWEVKDEEWARKMGFGRPTPLDPETYVVKEDKYIFMQAGLYAKLKQRQQAAPEYVTMWRNGRMSTVFHPGRKNA